MNEQQQKLIDTYISGYNSFNMKKMLLPLHSKVVFENYVKGELQMKLEGVKAFKKQAQKGFDYYSKRRQEIISTEYQEDRCEALINYSATLKIDIGDQKKKGDVMNMSAKSIFFFKDDRISRIEDYS